MPVLSNEARERKRNYQNEYRRKNKDRINKLQREWRARNPEKVREYQTRYWENAAKAFVN